jgi:hypothetical protein
MRIEKALKLRAGIRRYLNAPAKELAPVPFESRPADEAVRILQAEILELVEAVAELAKVVEDLRRQTGQVSQT